MTLVPDYGADPNVFDGRQQVNVEVPEAEEGFTAWALKRPVTERELELSGGLYMPGDVRWHFAATSLEEEPVVGTLISETGGRVWSVIDVQDGVFGARCTCTSRLVSGP
jgi:hypothetical protein